MRAARRVIWAVSLSLSVFAMLTHHEWFVFGSGGGRSVVRVCRLSKGLVAALGAQAIFIVSKATRPKCDISIPSPHMTYIYCRSPSSTVRPYSFLKLHLASTTGTKSVQLGMKLSSR
jgi:hypothetical protein